MTSNSEGLIIYGVMAYIDRDNIDTDQIIPTEYLKSIKKYGFEDYLFDGWRFADDGKLGITKEERILNENFILNTQPYDKSKILLARDNFGCGSSREHAVWALRDFGIKAVIASSFGDIFYNNCFKNGVLPIKLNKEEIQQLFKRSADSVLSLSIDLIKKEIQTDNDYFISFEVDKNLLDRIVFGLDDIDITLSHKNDIIAFEKSRMKKLPWIFAND
tara:strand:+ start:325 stop:975 length:651 start_codon:yes stop_codon:yes gene_type:complete